MRRRAAKRERRFFSTSFKMDAVDRLQKSSQTIASFARSLDVDESLLHAWTKKFGGAVAKARATPQPQDAIREDGERPHAKRIGDWLAKSPRSIHGFDWEDLCASVSEAVADTLHETHVDGGELLAELANQGHRVSEIWPPPEKGARYTLRLFDPQPSTSQVGRRKHYRLLNPWGPHV